MEIIAGSFPLLLILIIVLSIVFRKGNKRLLWVLVLLFLVIASNSLKAVGAILIYALPESAIVQGINFPYLPVINGLIILLLSFLLIFMCRKTKLPPTEQPPSKRWLWFSLGVVTPIIAVLAFLVSVYAPQVIGSDVPNPQIGVIANVAITTAGAFLLYYSSTLNTPTQQNLLRWLSFLCIVVFSFSTLSMMLILIYVVPAEVETTYPFLAGVLSCNITILSIAAVGIAKDYIPKLKNKDV